MTNGIRCAAAALLVLASACGGSPEQREGDGKVDVPQPSGPPVVQQIQKEERGPKWRSAEGSEGPVLILNDQGWMLMSIECLNDPARLVVSVPGFTPIGSEDRFSLGIGSEPVTLVVDPTRQPAAGLVAEGAAPATLGALLTSAREISALYGTQQEGPHPAPSRELVSGFADRCR